MTDKDLKNIYEYMGWSNKFTLETTTLTGDKISFSTPQTIPLDSNSAWEVVQEMYRQSDWEDFVNYCWVEDYVTCQNVMFIMNPTSFFDCLGKWLEKKKLGVSL